MRNRSIQTFGLMERAMGHFRFAAFAASTAIFACCAASAHARDAHMQIAQQLDQQLYEQKLQHTRENIKKQTTTPNPTDNTKSDQLAVDICKKNPQLPQCKFK
jgi:hypothetical protein